MNTQKTRSINLSACDQPLRSCSRRNAAQSKKRGLGPPINTIFHLASPLQSMGEIVVPLLKTRCYQPPTKRGMTMKNQLPAILLGIVCVALAWGLASSKKENKGLKQELASLKTTEKAPAPPKGAPEAKPSAIAHSKEEAEAPRVPEEKVAASEAKEASGRRMMKSMSQMMDNPTMSKVMEASQRGAVGVLYSDLMEYLDLDREETKYFMDLLMSRQMKNVELAIKMMSGELSEEEKKVLTEEIKTVGETVKEEIEAFLNNPEDVAEWEFYEKTMGERMMLSQVDQKLSAADATLSDEAYRELLGMMHDEKKDFQFTSNLHDDKNMDLSAERFSTENLQNFASDIEQLNGNIIQRAQGMLTPEQFTAFSESLKATTEMQQAQLEMAAQMFGGEGK